jgi:hypothetical protein
VTDAMVVQIGLQAMLLATKLAGPILLTTLGSVWASACSSR